MEQDWKAKFAVDKSYEGINNDRIIKMLSKPIGKIDVILDTDTYNEIDDQFALSYLVKSTQKATVKAIYAAPFYNEKSTGPADGMEKSYNEIIRVLQLLKRADLIDNVFRGSDAYLASENEPVISDAAKDLAKRAMSYSEDNPLYVVAIGAITNIASAILINPEIRNRIVVVWLGGNSFYWPHNKEFNLFQDVAAARIIFGCGVPLVQLPCMGVVSAFTISGPELECHLRGKNELCDYLADVTINEAKEHEAEKVWTRIIWDVTAVAWLLNEEFEDDYLVHSPIPEYSGRYSFDNGRHFIKQVYHINRDKVFSDLFDKLTSMGE